MKGALIALVVALGLAPLIGGQLSVEAQPLGPGAGALIASLFSGGATPALASAALTILALGAFAAMLWRRRAVQTASWTVGLPIIALLAILGASVGVSQFRFVSAQAWIQWLGYGVAFAAVMAVAGRDKGPKALIAALVAGCALVSLRGIAEYGQMRAIDPSWRVFAGWVNQNALAGMLMLGLFPALALTLRGERIERIAAASAATVIGFALVLTQSRGGFLAVGTGMVLFVVLGIFWAGWRRTAIAALPLVIVAALAFGVQTTAARQEPQGGGVLGRVTQAGAAEAQSSGFRRLLWVGAVQLMRTEPAGSGVGAYRFVSAKPGLNQQTHLAHNTYLQLGVEATPLAPVALVLAGAGWLAAMFRGARKLPDSRNTLRLGIVAAVGASAVHNLVDSDLYHFGIGFSFFALLALGLLLAADGGTPELMPAVLRRAGAGLCGLLGVMALYFGVVEATKARVVGDAIAGDAAGVFSGLERLVALAPQDGDTWTMRAQMGPESRDPVQRIVAWRRAEACAPTLRTLRVLAREHAARGEFASAESYLARVLRLDPNNLLALHQRMTMRVEEGQVEAALADARKLVRVEASPYVQARAISEIVPRQPLEARLLLARHESNAQQLARWLEGAIDGYVRYAETTIPQVRNLVRADPNGNYAGESWADVVDAMGKARGAASDLAHVYRSLGEPDRAASVESLASTVFAEPAI